LRGLRGGGHGAQERAFAHPYALCFEAPAARSWLAGISANVSAGTERSHDALRFRAQRLTSRSPGSKTQEEHMSIFGKIMSAIFKSASPPGTSPSVVPSQTPPGATAAATTTQVDVEAVLTKLAERSEEDLDWRRSIVDLMKLLNLDSSIAARKQLAQELHYAGNLNDSASMNVWLHKQVMQKLAENGGKVPADLMAR
jgi:Domain of unknown function (DUF3597)